jgi:hypothetical protein
MFYEMRKKFRQKFIAINENIDELNETAVTGLGDGCMPS